QRTGRGSSTCVRWPSGRRRLPSIACRSMWRWVTRLPKRLYDRQMRAAEVMILDPVVAAAGATSSEIAALMRVKNISVVPVVDNPKDRRYMGTISDRDIVARCVGAGHDPTDCSAADHARTDTPVVRPETELKGYKVAKQLDPTDHHVRSTIVVLNGEKKVVGFIPHPEEIDGIQIQE